MESDFIKYKTKNMWNPLKGIIGGGQTEEATKPMSPEDRARLDARLNRPTTAEVPDFKPTKESRLRSLNEDLQSMKEALGRLEEGFRGLDGWNGTRSFDLARDEKEKVIHPVQKKIAEKRREIEVIEGQIRDLQQEGEIA